MPRRFQNVLQNFATGAISPRMAARVDFEAYKNSLKEAKNFIISQQGGAAFREGMQYIGIPPSNQAFRLFQFRRGGDVSDILVEISEGLIRYWVEDDNGGLSLFKDERSLLTDENDGAFLIDENDGAYLSIGVAVHSNPYSFNDLETVYFTNQDKYAVICHESHPPIYITLERDGSIAASTLASAQIPRYQYNDIDSPTTVAEAAKWEIRFVGDWWETKSGFIRIWYNGVEPTWNGTDPDVEIWSSSTTATNETSIDYLLTTSAEQQGFDGVDFVVTGISGTEGSGGAALGYEVEITGPDSGYDIKIVGATQDPAAYAEAIYVGEGDARFEPAWSYPYYVYSTTTTHYYKCIKTHKADATNEPGVGIDWPVYWEDVGIVKPIGFDFQYPDGNEWTLLDVNGIENTYSVWGRGFPTVCQFHDQRLLLMANKDNPTAVYGSAINAFRLFTPGPNDDDAFLFVLDSSDTPKIKWAVSQGNLTLGTSSGEWSLTADVTITPTDIHAEQQNAARSYLSTPVQIDVEILYIELGQRKLRVTRYVDTNRSYSSSDVSVLAEHILSTSGIKRLSGISIPENCIIAVRNDGQPVFLTYEKTQPIFAFTEMETDGFVYDVSGFFSVLKNRDYFYFATLRNGTHVIERMRYPCSKICSNPTANNVVHMDGWVSGIVSGSTIENLQHLEGKTVGVLINDAWQIGEYVVNNGRVTLNKDFTGAVYSVGLVYTGLLQTFEVIDNFRTTGIGTKRRWNKLTTRLLNSALPLVYTKRDRDRTPPTVMGSAETIREGLQDVTQTVVGYGDGSVTIEQNRPYPTYVLGFFGEYQVEDR